MNKEELLNRINNLPLFEKRDIKIKEGKESHDEFVDEEIMKAICEVGKNEPHAFVGTRYHIVQFKEVFEPIVRSMTTEVRGYVITNGGYAQLILFPDDPVMSQNGESFGIVAANSIDCSSSISVRFCVEKNGIRISIPEKVAGLKKMHTKSADYAIKNYASLIGPVKKVWNRIIEEFPKYNVRLNGAGNEYELDIKDVIKQLKLGDRLGKSVIERYEEVTQRQSPFTLWDVFMTVINNLNDKDYKSEVHKQKRIDSLCKAIFEYSFVLSL